MTDIVFEAIRSVVIAALILYVLYSVRTRELPTNGWFFAIGGLTLIFLGSVIDITDNFESLNRYVVIGDTEVQAFLEKVVGSLLGFTLLTIGLLLWIPTLSTLEKIVSAYNELAHAENNLRILAGLLPICCSCKRIRDDSGYWNQVERYIRNHSEAEFTHSICPDCMEEQYPGCSN